MFTPTTIAVVRTDRLGDMVLTLPMFPALRERFPRARLQLYTRNYVRPLVQNLECIDDVVYVDTAPGTLRSALGHHHVDTAFFPRPRFEEVWDAIRAGVSQRIGSAYRWYAPLYTYRIREHRSDATFHEAEYNVRMISHAFGGNVPPVHLVQPSLAAITPEDMPRSPLPIPYIVLHPGSGGSACDWPIDRMAQLARQLVQLGYGVVITGTEQERALAHAIAAMCPEAVDLCGTGSLTQLMHVLRGASAVVCNSTGVIHVAAALGIPVVGLYPTTPSMSARRWGPYTLRRVILESRVGDDMSTIPVDDVLEATLRAVTAGA